MLDSSESRWDDGPYGAITLMDILDIFKQQIAISSFVVTRSHLAQIGDSAVVSETALEDVISTLTELAVECNLLGIDSCADLISYTRMQCENKEKPVTAGRLAEKLAAIDYVFKTQCNKQTFFRLNKEESAMFSSQEPFGSEVAKAFSSPESTHEISEAAKSYALGRNTASVFHLMRVLEKGLKSLADKLVVPFTVPFEYQNWQNVIEQIESRIKDLEKQKAGQQKTEDLKAYSEAAKQFRYFKDAWRNHVAHSRETYGPEQALSIRRHVGEFMLDLVKIGLSE
jgi:hypothetical protein